MKKDNRFAVLRRKNRDISRKADITTEELAEMLDVSVGTISRLENKCVKGEVPDTTAIVLKNYHDKLGCSYEYLMGETEHETNKYASVATVMPFKMLTTQDIDNLAYVFSDPQYGSMYAAFFSAMLSKPNKLKELIHSLVRSFNDISNINTKKDYPKQDKEFLRGPVRYTYTTMFAERMEKHFIPCMEKVFSEYNDILAEESERNIEDLATIDLDNPVLSTGEYKEDMKPITTKKGDVISNVKITKIETGDSQ